MSTPRFCPNCGAQVATGERFCANCGSRMPDMATPVGGQPALDPTIMVPPVVIPGAEPSPLPPPDATPPQGQGAMHLPADTPLTPAPPPRRGLPLWAILLLGLAGLCVIGCVASFALLAYFGEQVSGNVGTAVVEIATAVATPEEDSGLIVPTLVATPEEDSGLIVPTLEEMPTRPPETTVEAAPTAEEAPTSGAGGGIAGGAVGGAASAGQVQTSVAATAQSLESTAELGQLFSGAREVFKDEFVDNRNAWFTGVFEEIETDKIEDGVFKVIWAGNGSSYELYEVRELTNFIAEVDCLILTGGTDGSCGLVFGQRPDVGFYKFELFEDYYRLFTVQVEGDPPILAEGNPEGVVRPGEPNRLRAIKQGDRIRLYLNDVLLADVSDSTYPTGKIGVSTNSYNDAGGVEVWFDNIIIWELPT